MREVEINENELENDLENEPEIEIENIPKKSKSFLSAPVLDMLKKNTDVYIDMYNNKTLNMENALGVKNMTLTSLDARLELLDSIKKGESPEAKECSFLIMALAKGWLLTDVNFLSKMYEAVQLLPEGEEKNRGLDIVSDIEFETVDASFKRNELMAKCFSFVSDMAKQGKADFQAALNAYDVIKDRKVLEVEFPEEDNVDNLDEAVRRKQDYVMETLDEEDFEEFERENSHILNNINKSNREAIKEVMGEEVYDDIDEIYQGTKEERTVKIHHAVGNKWLRKGEDVLEMNFLASGRDDEWRQYKGRDGSINEDISDVDKDQIYGFKATDSKGNEYSNTRYKTRSVTDKNGNVYTKTRFVIGGASPSLGGAFNLGPNSIESVKYYGQEFAGNFLKEHFDKWINHEEAPHDLHISITGWSRGAVAAGQSVKKINEWIDDYKKKNPGIRNHLNHLKIDMFIKDPVPGAITNLHLSTCNLRNVPNLNATVYCTLANDHYDFIYPFQHFKGAKKIIISTEEHELDFSVVDKTQEKVKGDRKSHQNSFYDAETGELFRGSGMSELQDGVYITDENHNLIRLSSYSQLGKLSKSLFGDGEPQRTRKNNIHKMVRDWFVENNLEMSFPDEETRTLETEKFKIVSDRILNSGNSRIRTVKTKLQELENLKNSNASENALYQKNQELIRVCKKYMKKTRIPASGDSEYRVNLVSDLLSFTMRESNHLKTEIERKTNPEYENPLDKKIKENKKRIERKSGSQERKLEKEKARLGKEKSIQQDLKKVIKLCKNYYGDIRSKDGDRIYGSDEYYDFLRILKKGSTLGENTSIEDFTGFLKKLTEISDKYVDMHTFLRKPLTSAGSYRVKMAKLFADVGKKVGRETEGRAIYLSNKNVPISKDIEVRQSKVDVLTAKVNEKKVVVQNAGPELEQKLNPKPQMNNSKTL
ncbi:MAG: hypothetical protein K6E28_01765 [Eubacterium sp.]|nr:hypothetical protein [Eubacterium sp.]